MSAEKPQEDSDNSNTDNDAHPDFRSGSKLAGELAEEFAFLETTDRKDGGDQFTVRNTAPETFLLQDATEMAAKHGFRVQDMLSGGETLLFTRITDHKTDPRTD